MDESRRPPDAEFLQLAEKAIERVFRRCFRGQRDQWEDLRAAAWVQVWRVAPCYDATRPEDEPRNWLETVVYRAMLREVLRPHVPTSSLTIFDPQTGEETEMEVADPHAEAAVAAGLERAERTRAITCHLARLLERGQLSKDDLRLLLARAVGTPYRLLAAESGYSESALRQKVHRIRERIARSMRDDPALKDTMTWVDHLSQDPTTGEAKADKQQAARDAKKGVDNDDGRA